MAARRLRVVIYGIGEIGTELSRLICLQSHLEVVGVIDISPEKVGLDLGELTGLSRVSGIRVSNNPPQVLRETRPDVVVIATTSSLHDVFVQMQPALKVGASIVSTCEELIYPFARHKDLAAEIDAEARAAGVSVIGVGNNPGFAMDLLPILLTATCRDIEGIRVSRMTNISERRSQLLQRVGAGLDPAIVRNRLLYGSAAHVGLLESLYMIADALSWTIDHVEEQAELIVAQDWIRTPFLTIAPGQVSGFCQEARAWVGHHEVIELRWRAAAGEGDSFDSIIIEGVPPIKAYLKGGIHGDVATAALVTRAVPAIASAAPGLHTVLDLPILHYVAPPWRGGRY